MLVASFVQREFSRRYARHRLTLSEWRLMLELHHEGPDSAGAIARRVGLTPMAASRAAASLIAARRATRERDPRDARRQVLALTPAGRALFQRVYREGIEMDALLLDAVPTADRAALGASLDAMLARARAAAEAPGG